MAHVPKAGSTVTAVPNPTESFPEKVSVYGPAPRSPFGNPVNTGFTRDSMSASISPIWYLTACTVLFQSSPDLDLPRISAMTPAAPRSLQSMHAVTTPPETHRVRVPSSVHAPNKI